MADDEYVRATLRSQLVASHFGFGKDMPKALIKKILDGYGTCEVCGGQGYRWFETSSPGKCERKRFDCETCHGTGTIPPKSKRMPSAGEALGMPSTMRPDMTIVGGQVFTDGTPAKKTRKKKV